MQSVRFWLAGTALSVAQDYNRNVPGGCVVSTHPDSTGHQDTRSIVAHGAQENLTGNTQYTVGNALNIR
jgi:hypothetical protein